MHNGIYPILGKNTSQQFRFTDAADDYFASARRADMPIRQIIKAYYLPSVIKQKLYCM